MIPILNCLPSPSRGNIASFPASHPSLLSHRWMRRIFFSFIGMLDSYWEKWHEPNHIKIGTVKLKYQFVPDWITHVSIVIKDITRPTIFINKDNTTTPPLAIRFPVLKKTINKITNNECIRIVPWWLSARGQSLYIGRRVFMCFECAIVETNVNIVRLCVLRSLDTDNISEIPVPLTGGRNW